VGQAAQVFSVGQAADVDGGFLECKAFEGLNVGSDGQHVVPPFGL
jgi:hypothetical protein